MDARRNPVADHASEQSRWLPAIAWPPGSNPPGPRTSTSHGSGVAPTRARRWDGSRWRSNSLVRWMFGKRSGRRRRPCKHARTNPSTVASDSVHHRRVTTTHLGDIQRHPSNRRNRMAMRKSACGRECFRRIPLIDRLKGKPCFAGLSQLGEPGWASPVHRENGFVGRYRADQRGRTAWLPGKRSCGRGAFKTFAYKRSGAGVEHAGRHGHNGLPVSRPDCLGGGRGRRRCQRARSSGRCGTPG
jgi:hypothetical protein